ncbi:MAG TPA: hypothetical protein VII40_00745 [Xanthobacteraceae bacterium]|jgi:hypothetical protein
MIAARPIMRSVALGATVTAAIGLAASESPAGEPSAFDRPQRVQAPDTLPRHFHFRVLNTLADIAAALEICWEANEPPLADARPGMNVTVMLTFTRTGEILGEPRFTYTTPEATAETKARYQRAAVAAIDACVPLPFSPGLGNALAGTPKVMPFIDRRNEKGI